MIDHDRKLLFIHIARTGGSSVETALVGKDWWQVDPGSKHILRIPTQVDRPFRLILTARSDGR